MKLDRELVWSIGGAAITVAFIFAVGMVLAAVGKHAQAFREYDMAPCSLTEEMAIRNFCQHRRRTGVECLQRYRERCTGETIQPEPVRP